MTGIVKPIQTTEDRMNHWKYMIANKIGDMMQNVATIDMHLSKGKLSQAQVDEIYALLPVAEEPVVE